MKLFLLILNIIFWVSCQSIQKEEINIADSESKEVKASSSSYDEVGFATWYGIQFQGKETASGEIFDNKKFTGAHRSMPFGSIVKVQNLENNKSASIRINDRGSSQEGTIIEVSKIAAEELNFKEDGFAKVGINILEKSEENNILMKDDSFGVDDDEDDDDDDEVDDETSPPISKPDPKKKPPVTNNPPPTKTVAPAKKVEAPAKQNVIQVPDEVNVPVPTKSNVSSGSQPKGHTVQIGVFKEERRAESFRDAIKKEYTEKVFLFSRAGTYVVQIGDFAKRDDAVTLRDKLKANKVPNCFIPPKF